jgi:hypothetical protein
MDVGIFGFKGAQLFDLVSEFWSMHEYWIYHKQVGLILHQFEKEKIGRTE